jgi:hypothetical protein
LKNLKSSTFIRLQPAVQALCACTLNILHGGFATMTPSVTSSSRAGSEHDNMTHKQREGEGQWKKALDPSSGEVFYYHTATQDTQWIRPEEYDSDHSIPITHDSEYGSVAETPVEWVPEISSALPQTLSQPARGSVISELLAVRNQISRLRPSLRRDGLEGTEDANRVEKMSGTAPALLCAVAKAEKPQDASPFVQASTKNDTSRPKSSKPKFAMTLADTCTPSATLFSAPSFEPLLLQPAIRASTRCSLSHVHGLLGRERLAKPVGLMLHPRNSLTNSRLDQQKALAAASAAKKASKAAEVVLSREREIDLGKLSHRQVVA